MRPLARGYQDGKVYRTSPLFTFDSIMRGGRQVRLGSNAIVKTPSGASFVCVITSIFMREDPNLNGAKTIACNVQQYVPLNAIKLKNLVEAANVSERELVLKEEENCLFGETLACIRHEVQVLFSKEEFKGRSNDGEVYLCRLGFENGQARPWK